MFSFSFLFLRVVPNYTVVERGGDREKREGEERAKATFSFSSFSSLRSFIMSLSNPINPKWKGKSVTEYLVRPSQERDRFVIL